jgi:hypothetical protein
VAAVSRLAQRIAQADLTFVARALFFEACPDWELLIASDLRNVFRGERSTR